MPASGGVNDRKVARAVAAQTLATQSLDTAAARVVALVLAAQAARPRATPHSG